MLYKSKCYFCNIIINDLVTFDIEKINSNLINLSDDNFSFWIDNVGSKSCKHCGIKYHSWNKNGNKFKLLSKREIYGKFKINIPSNTTDICNSCNTIFKKVNNIEDKKYKINNNKYCEYCWNQYILSFSF
jgi:hypothetical protein